MKNIRRVNVVFLITVIIALAGSLFLGNISLIRENPIVNLLTAQALYIIPVVIYLVTGTENIKELLRIKRIRAANVILLVVFAFLISPLLTFLNAVSLLFTTNTIMNVVTGIVSTSPLIISILIIAGVPAVLEESIYRGVFFNEYRKINPGLGVILSGLLFGLMHMNFNQFMYAFVMGMIFALLVEATDSILASMIVHFAINASSVILSWMLPKMQALLSRMQGVDAELVQEIEMTYPTVQMLIPVIILYGVIAVFTTTAAWFLLNGICKIEGRADALKKLFRHENRETEKEIVTLPLLVGIAVCFFLMLYQQFYIN